MPPKEDFFCLLYSVHKRLFPYLTLEELHSLKLTTKQVKNIVNSYVYATNKLCVLKMPPNIKYTNADIQNLDKIIVIRCENIYNKTPPECEIHLQTRIFYNTRKGRISSTIPLKALKKIGATGIKIVLSITIDPNGLSEKELWEVWRSYNVLIEETLRLLPNIESLDLVFLNKLIREVEDEKWFEGISKSLKNLQHLTSLSISGRIYWNPVLICISSMSQLTSLSVCDSWIPEVEFITCISSMTQLINLNISKATLSGDALFNCLAIIQPLSLGFFSAKIIDMDIMEFARRLNLYIPGLVKLKLSNSYVDSEQIYESLSLLRLPNLTSLDLSNNFFDTNTMIFQNQIIPQIIKMTNLTSLDLSHNEIDVKVLLPLLNALNNLVDLNLKDNSITSEDILVLIPTLQKMPFLSSFNISSNKLDQDTINELKKQLRRVKKLDISDNSLVE